MYPNPGRVRTLAHFGELASCRALARMNSGGPLDHMHRENSAQPGNSMSGGKDTTMNRRFFVYSFCIPFIAFAVALPTAAVFAAERQASSATLVRFHSPTLGPPQAPVTIVEFFDPACEACRAVYPVVKNLLQRFPQDVRLVLRYAAFHDGSDAVIRLLEASKRQGRYWQVLEALLAAQPQWADHHRPNVQIAYRMAEQAGLNLKQALTDAGTPQIDAILKQEMQDLAALKIVATPTFYVNGELVSGGPDKLAAAVAAEVARRKAGGNR